MDRVYSDWKITYDPMGLPLVLVDFGQWIDGELDIPWKRTIQQSMPVGAKGGEFLNRNLTTREIVFGVYKDHASFAIARNYMMQQQVDLPDGINAPVRFQVQGGDTFQLAGATFPSGNCRIIRKVQPFRTWTQWRIAGGTLTKV